MMVVDDTQLSVILTIMVADDTQLSNTNYDGSR